MRARYLLLGTVLLALGVAGCIGTDTPGPEAASTDAADLTAIDVPENATLEETEAGVQLVWEDEPLPLETPIQIAPDATLVKVEGEGSDVTGVRVTSEDTGRRRCNVDVKDAWEDFRSDSIRCAGLTAVDELPTNWTLNVGGSAGAGGPMEEAPTPRAERITVELLDVEIEGPASKLDLDKLSMPTHELKDTQQVRIESHDGTELYAEVTVPEGEGPWPVIIASSPYNSGYHASGQPSMWEYWTQDWAKRGYAVINADVRGTGRSDGCMEVWGPNETEDQRVLVDWAAEQAFSNGHVGFYGQSYVGTTPTEAAVQAPEALDAIITVAPVVNAYDDWHFGGVPNGENVGSPAFYQASTGGASDLEWDPMNPTEGDPARSAIQAANGVCDPTLTARANDPRATYDEFYEVRNFSTSDSNVEAATLYTHGFEDTNVKSDMITHWFNGIDAPKLALLGHWDHQHPTRADNEVLFLAWMDEHVKGKEMGFEEVANVSVTPNEQVHRTGETWPPEDASTTSFFPDFDGDELSRNASEGSATITLSSADDLAGPTPAPAVGEELVLEGTLEEPIHLAGKPGVDLTVSLEGADNAHVAAFLYEVGDGEATLATFGMANLAHRNGHDSYEPVPPGEQVQMRLPMLPTERQLDEGDDLRLVVRGTQTTDWSTAEPTKPGQLTVHGGEDGTALALPTLEEPRLDPRPPALAP